MAPVKIGEARNGIANAHAKQSLLFSRFLRNAPKE
jgi:hypothetical protein